jgi:hypothetical protein
MRDINIRRLAYAISQRAEDGIRAVDTLGDLGSQPTEEVNEDSVFDENEEILAWKRLDFDEEDGMEFDAD